MLCCLLSSRRGAISVVLSGELGAVLVALSDEWGAVCVVYLLRIVRGCLWCAVRWVSCCLCYIVLSGEWGALSLMFCVDRWVRGWHSCTTLSRWFTATFVPRTLCSTSKVPGNSLALTSALQTSPRQISRWGTILLIAWNSQAKSGQENKKCLYLSEHFCFSLAFVIIMCFSQIHYLWSIVVLSTTYFSRSQ